MKIIALLWLVLLVVSGCAASRAVSSMAEADQATAMDEIIGRWCGDSGAMLDELRSARNAAADSKVELHFFAKTPEYSERFMLDLADGMWFCGNPGTSLRFDDGRIMMRESRERGFSEFFAYWHMHGDRLITVNQRGATASWVRHSRPPRPQWREFLANADEFTIYRLDSSEKVTSQPQALISGYPIIEQRQCSATEFAPFHIALLESVRHAHELAMCFDPGFAVSARKGTHTLLMLLCFHCRRSEVSLDERTIAAPHLSSERGGQEWDELFRRLPARAVTRP